MKRHHAPICNDSRVVYLNTLLIGETACVWQKTTAATYLVYTWWRHQMETFSALLALCAGNSPVPVNSPHKGQYRGALMFYLIYAWINDWVNNREAGDLRRQCGHYDVIVMSGKYQKYAAIVVPTLLRHWLPNTTLIARFMGPTWDPPRADKTHARPTIAPWPLLSGNLYVSSYRSGCCWIINAVISVSPRTAKYFKISKRW